MKNILEIPKSKGGFPVESGKWALQGDHSWFR